MTSGRDRGEGGGGDEGTVPPGGDCKGGAHKG